ncbi:uncharacterized protein LOC129587003 [Paramacrobiotus metropolitanus]|uniref:uncharacterized protein LOC129587003 n=1 Tax=Paramacrobiotus metropolitanus TaxID=2943436 RepID=UPI0024464279|nr:uncharacterized protein LOC129587003 [Paramacrobiotus metropolitanus]
MFFMNHSNASFNQTFDWDSGATIQTIISFTTVAVNGFALGLLIQVHMHHNAPFNIYLMHLLLANIYLTLPDACRIMGYINYPGYFGSVWCRLAMYSDEIGSAMVKHAHLLISVNRIWALIFPVSYRNCHTTTVALLICASAVVCCHVVLLPLLIRDYLFYQYPESAGICDTNDVAQSVYSFSVYVICFMFPNVFMYVSYPFLCWKYRHGRRVFVHFAVSYAKSTTTSGGSRRHSERSPPSLAKDHQRGFRVLAVLTVTIFVCWTPSMVRQVLLRVCGFGFDLLQRIGDTLYAVQGILDPVLFALVLGDLRKRFTQLFKCN